MRRTASVLGSALVTLALAASPAWAGTPAQSTKDSTLAAQVGPVDVDAPVRIASDGDNQGAAQAKGGSQGIDDSTGAAQVGPVEANAPVRVLSDGENQAGAQRDSDGQAVHHRLRGRRPGRAGGRGCACAHRKRR